MPIRTLIATLLLIVAVPAGAQVLNPDFDTDAAHWAFILDIGGGGIVEWASAVGDPAPGSARAGNVFAGARRDGWKQCVPFAATDFAVSARVASSVLAGNACRLRVDFIAGPDCVDGAPIVLESVSANTRIDGGFETLAAGGVLPVGIQAAAVFLEHIRGANAPVGDSFCHFDHIAVTADTIFAAAFE